MDKSSHTIHVTVKCNYLSMPPGGHLNTCMKMLSFQYRNPHVKDKTASRLLSLTWESPYLGRTFVILRLGPDSCLCAHVLRWIDNLNRCMIMMGKNGSMTLALHNVHKHTDGLVQERRNSSALAMELRLSCTNSTIQYIQSLSKTENQHKVHGFG